MSAARNKYLSVLWDYLIVTIGTFFYCIAWDCFLIPNNIASGGLTGACTIIQFATGGLIPLSYSFFVLNVFLLITGAIVLGKGFGIKTVYAVLLSTVLFRILPTFDFIQAVPGNFLYVDNRLLIPIM